MPINWILGYKPQQKVGLPLALWQDFGPNFKGSLRD